jgi:hypothetical protein
MPGGIGAGGIALGGGVAVGISVAVAVGVGEVVVVPVGVGEVGVVVLFGPQLTMPRQAMMRIHIKILLFIYSLLSNQTVS